MFLKELMSASVTMPAPRSIRCHILTMFIDICDTVVLGGIITNLSNLKTLSVRTLERINIIIKILDFCAVILRMYSPHASVLVFMKAMS